jgi:hypothetical protein
MGSLGLHDAPRLSWEELLAVFARHEVRSVVVGDVAAELHGASRSARRLDICPAWRRENFDRLVTALEEVDGRLRPDFEVRASTELLRETPVTLWRTRAGDLGVRLACPGEYGVPVGFGELAPRALEITLAGAPVLVAALDDLIASMEHAHLDRDEVREALRELRALRAATDSLGKGDAQNR